MNWRIWNLDLKESTTDFLLFIRVIIWNVEHILYYAWADYQSQMQCAAEILTYILNVWKSQLMQGQTLKKTHTRIYPTRL